ncbi:9147_t:CDS:2 [Racocetra fulgida]|uniref:9147_t:CDS:1 n=1 Tax=Racocetra fulgida TaxID=60492 RepID=A0A9N9EXT0_9GLOM|nr:9147_t:CDS:2 [Racocetra fulgida]
MKFNLSKKELKQLENASEKKKVELRLEILFLKKAYINSLSLYNSKEKNIDIANLDLFIQINRGLNCIENHIRGAEILLNNPINIINGIRGFLNDIHLNYQNAFQDIDGVIT